jgi:hypothetical protein
MFGGCKVEKAYCPNVADILDGTFNGGFAICK